MKILKAIFGYKRLFIGLLAPIAFILVLIAKNNSAFAEWYTVNIYHYISQAWNFLSALLPFSLAEFIVVMLVPFALTYIVVSIVKIIKKKGSRGKTAYKAFLNVICAVSLVFFLFITNFGICYYRNTFAETNGIEIRESTVDELYSLCIDLAKNASKARENLSENDGIMTLTSLNEAKAETQKAMNSLYEKYPTIFGGYSKTKSVMLSELMSYTQITGVFFPFTFEANVNVAVPEFSIPATMCHELSHLRGFAREDEANFIAYLACINSDNAEVQYSGYMLAFIHSVNALYSYDVEKYQEVFSYLSDKAKSDLNANNEYWAKYETPVAEVASSINDSYLKANSQDDGTKSYGRMVDLLLAYSRK